MILIVGGAFQGKKKVAAQLAGMTNENWLAQAANGADCTWEQACECRFLFGIHHYIRRILKTGASPEELTEHILESEFEMLILDEIGYGIVPMDPWERCYREAAGKAGQRLAKQADAVYRVVCAVPTRIR